MFFFSQIQILNASKYNFEFQSQKTTTTTKKKREIIHSRVMLPQCESYCVLSNVI